MPVHVATVVWERGADEAFADGRFHRGHHWTFDGGLMVRASSSPAVIPRYSDASGIDPEEAFVASLSSCHMMSFLYVAGKRGLVVNRYSDTAEGLLSRTAEGQYWISRVVLRPLIVWEGDAPDEATIADLHDLAHRECFIAHSVRTEVSVEPAA
ncbi:OsmC family protein [Ensifer soli]|uniref:OsmC family protein n=1 Tax=Ciceribacter sp. sgz301302 TaxID=3342379 RepID=UPI0035B9DF7F